MLSSALLISGGTLVFLSLQLTQDLPISDRNHAVLFTITGILFFSIGVLSAFTEEKYLLIDRLLTTLTGWFQIYTWQLICLFVCIPLAIMVPIAAGVGEKLISPISALIAWGTSITLAIIGGWYANTTRHKPGKLLLLEILIIFLIAFIPRIIKINSIPILLSGDEGSSGLASLNFANGMTNNIFITSWYSFPSLFFEIQSKFILIFGRTQQALRMLSAIIGSLTIVVTFLVGRTLFNKTTGIYAAIFLSASNYFIHFSRIGLNNIFDAFWFTVVVGSLWIGIRKHNRNAYLLAGTAMGLAQYFYPSGRVLILLCIIIILAGIFLFHSNKKQLIPNIFLFLFTSIIISLPLIWFYIKHINEFLAPFARVVITPEWFNYQMVESGKTEWEIFLSQLKLGFQAFTYTPLQAWYQSGKPILLPLSASLFILGVTSSLVLPDRKKYIPFIFWIIAFGLIGSFSESTPAAQRYVAVAPACALFVGYGAFSFANILKRIFPSKKLGIAVAGFILIVFASSLELNFYFNFYTIQSKHDLAHSNGMIAQKLADYLKSQPLNQQIVFFGSPVMGYYSIPSIQFLAPGFEGIDIQFPWGSVENPVPTGQNLIFIFLPFHVDQIPLVEKDYPGGIVHVQLATDNTPLFWLYEYSY